MRFYGDYHTHSRHSDGRQSHEEIVRAAKKQGLREVAVTDHGPLAAGIGVKNSRDYLVQRREIERLQPSFPEVKILLGAEANIRDLKGTLDIPPEVIEELDILVAGLHPYTLPTSVQDGWKIFAQNSLRHLGKGQREKAVNNNTKASVEAIYQNPRLDILAHPGLFFRVDVVEVARACVRKGVFFEINCGHEHPGISDIMEAEQVGVDFIINSDAHFRETVGELNYGESVVWRLGIAEERVVNRVDGEAVGDGAKR